MIDQETLLSLKTWFSEYVKKFQLCIPAHKQNINLKEEHTKRVCIEIINIEKSLNLNKQDLRLVLEQIINHKESTIQGKVDERSEMVGKVIIEKGAVINKSSIFGPAIIGKNTVIENSYIGPFSSVSYDCEITNSELEYSIIMEQCRIIDVESRIERSILGKNVKITKGKCRPEIHCFIIGDQSSIKLI